MRKKDQNPYNPSQMSFSPGRLIVEGKKTLSNMGRHQHKKQQE